MTIEYLLKANGVLILLCLFYYALLKKETFFRSIRIYFLVGLVLVVSLPLVEIPIYSNDAFLGIVNLENVETTSALGIKFSLLDTKLFFV